MSSEPGPRRSRRGRTRPWYRPGARATLAAGVAVVLVLAGVLVAVRSGGSPSNASTHSGSDHRAADRIARRQARIKARDSAVRAVMRRRSEAILQHNPRALLATIDPTRTQFRRAQVQMLANLREVPFASWSYSILGDTQQRPTPQSRRYHVPTWTPSHVLLHYRLRGFDRRPTDLAQYPTFTRRHGHWYLASLSDFASRHRFSDTDLWDFGPVEVVRAPGVLALGPPADAGLLHEVADQASIAIPQVSAVWGRRWTQRAVIVVPQTQQEMGLVTGDRGDLDRIAALSSAEIRTTPGAAPAPVGARITINPVLWPTMSLLGRQVVIRHEMTHVATRSATDAATPSWLTEGFADYVAFRYTDATPTQIAAELVRDVRAGRLPERLPADRDFNGANAALAQAYEQAWLACRYIAQAFGEPRLVAFYRAVGTAGLPAKAAVGNADRRLLHLSPAQFTRRWRSYLRTVLG